jgi:hypothetical protein
LQEFSEEYTKSFLLHFLISAHNLKIVIPRRGPEVNLAVTCSTSSLRKYCRLRRDDSGKAQIIIGWILAIRAFKLKEGDVCMFTFKDTRHIPNCRRDQLA